MRSPERNHLLIRNRKKLLGQKYQKQRAIKTLREQLAIDYLLNFLT